MAVDATFGPMEPLETYMAHCAARHEVCGFNLIDHGVRIFDPR